jgi:hypothetical protein
MISRRPWPTPNQTYSRRNRTVGTTMKSRESRGSAGCWRLRSFDTEPETGPFRGGSSRLARSSLSAISVVRFGDPDGARDSACKFASWFRQSLRVRIGSSNPSLSATEVARAEIARHGARPLAENRAVFAVEAFQIRRGDGALGAESARSRSPISAAESSGSDCKGSAGWSFGLRRLSVFLYLARWANRRGSQESVRHPFSLRCAGCPGIHAHIAWSVGKSFASSNICTSYLFIPFDLTAGLVGPTKWVARGTPTSQSGFIGHSSLHGPCIADMRRGKRFCQACLA